MAKNHVENCGNPVQHSEMTTVSHTHTETHRDTGTPQGTAASAAGGCSHTHTNTHTNMEKTKRTGRQTPAPHGHGKPGEHQRTGSRQSKPKAIESLQREPRHPAFRVWELTEDQGQRRVMH